MDIRKPISAFAAAIGVTMSLQAACAASVNEFKHIVVIYQENHSLDNLYGLWGEVNGNSVSGLNEVNFFRTRQVREDNKTPYTCLLMNDVNLTSPSPLPASCTDYLNGAQFQSAFSNAPFKIDGSTPICMVRVLQTA
jgi:phospholipase C